MPKPSSKKKSPPKKTPPANGRKSPAPPSPAASNGQASLVAKIQAGLAGAKGDEVVHVPFGADDVGGEMVAIASEGLYADPRDALREYVQNSVDAGARKVSVILGASDAKIEDDGGGMSLDELLRARQFAKSSKSSLSSVGFRGIGIYAGFPICDRLRIETQRSGEKTGYTLTFDFKSMRERLLAERTARAGTERTTLPQLMTDGTSITSRRVNPIARGKTTVYLDNLNNHALAELADFGDLRQYLVNTLPVGYSPFEGRDAVEEFLRENVPGYRTVEVRLKNTVTKADNLVTRDYPARLGWPVFLEAWDPADDEDPKAKPQMRAVMWASRIDPKDKEHPAAGLLFKSRGFTIGDSDRTRRLFETRQTIVNWMVGEIWVVDPSVTPNAARNDFEASQARRRLEKALKSPIAALRDVIVFAQTVERAAKVFDDIERELPAVEESAASESYPNFADGRFQFYRLRPRFETQRFKKKLPALSQFTDASAERMRVDFTSTLDDLVKRQEGIASRLGAADVLFKTRFVPDANGSTGAEQTEGSETTSETTGAASSKRESASESGRAAAADGAATSGGSPPTESEVSDEAAEGGAVVATEGGHDRATGSDAGSSVDGSVAPQNGAAKQAAPVAEQLTLVGVVDNAGLRMSKDFRRGLDALSAALEETLNDQQRNVVFAAFRRRLGDGRR